MNDIESKFESRLNRLIDGELPAAEYRALVSSLDTVPDGWRRCALSFLESQALGVELGSLRRALDESKAAAPSAQPPSRPALANDLPLWKQRSLLLLAVAASFLIAFSLGLVAPDFFPATPQDPTLAGNLIDQNDQPTANPATGVRHAALRPVVGNVRLVMDGANGEPLDAGQVPVYEANGDLKTALANGQTISPALLELFKRSGFDVQHDQRYVPAPLEDGRQLIVPVDGYQLVPIGGSY